MQEILPLESYYGLARGPRLVLFLIAGGVSGATGGMLYRASQSLDPQSPVTGLIGPEILWGALVGIGLGFFARFALRIKLRFRTRIVYEAEIMGFSAPVPKEADYSHRLPAVLAQPASLAVAGVLYAGPGRLVFVPQRSTLLVSREPRPIPVGRDARFIAGERAPGPVMRFLGAPGVPTLEVSSGGGSWLFAIPDAEAAVATLRSVVVPGIA